MVVGVQPHSPATSTAGKEPVSILQEAGWAPGPVWTGGKPRPHRDSIPDRLSRSQTLYRLSYPAHKLFMLHPQIPRTQDLSRHFYTKENKIVIIPTAGADGYKLMRKETRH